MSFPVTQKRIIEDVFYKRIAPAFLHSWIQINIQINNISFILHIDYVYHLQIRPAHSRYVKAQRRARTMDVAPTAFALAPPRNGKVVDVASTAVSATMRLPFTNFFTYHFWGEEHERGHLPDGDRVVPVPVPVAVAVALLAALVSLDVRK